MLKPDLNIFLNRTSGNCMIIGNDLDALLSACLLKSRFGWDIVGIYDYQSLWYDSKLINENFIKNLKSQQYIAIDLDIYRNFLPSIGHHILYIHPEDVLPQHTKTMNPNLLIGVTHQNFKQKYPMGTVHFLMHVLNEYASLSRLGEMLLWLADSTFINAQSHRFRNNVKFWLNQYVPNQILINSFEETESLSFEEEMEKSIFPILKNTGIARGKGQIKSKHIKLQGYQCQWENPNESRKSVLSLFDIIKKNTGWEIPELPEYFKEIKGNRETYRFTYQDESKNGFLRNFLSENKVFSYVITNQYLINYTTGIDY